MWPSCVCVFVLALVLLLVVVVVVVLMLFVGFQLDHVFKSLRNRLDREEKVVRWDGSSL